MSFTGRLGTSDSRPGNLELGIDSSKNLDQVVSQTLGLTDTATTSNRPASASNALSLSSVASFVLAHPVSASNTLAFAQTASGLHAVFGSVSQSIAFAQTALGHREIKPAVSQALAFVQTVHENIIRVAVSQSMALVQSCQVHGSIHVSASNALSFTQNDPGHLSVIHKAVGQTLAFVDKVGRVLTASVSQTIAFTQLGARKNVITQTLSFSQLARVGKGGSVSQALGLIQTVVNKSVFRRSVAQALGLSQSVTYYIEHGCTDKQYSPFVGSTNVAGYTPPSLTPPTLVHGPMTLTYPYVAPTTTLVFRNPEFGDKDRLNFNRINRETRGGTLIIFADPKWPKTQVLAVQVDNLSAAQIADFLTFLQASLGKEIGLLDWEGRQWRGIITTPDTQATHVAKHDRSVTFEFQGSLA